MIIKKHFGKIEKTLQTNIAVSGLYDARLCGYNTVLCHTNHSSHQTNIVMNDSYDTRLCYTHTV